MLIHRKILHGGVASTMAAARSLFWIPVLRKHVIRNCNGCKRFKAMHYPSSKPGLLSRERTEHALPFEIVVTDYAGPLCYNSIGRKDLIIFLYCQQNCTSGGRVKSYCCRVHQKF